jgi:hypothetical protein
MTRTRGAPVHRAQAVTAGPGGDADTRLPADPPPEVRSRFELAAARMADAWLRAGRARLSAQDFRIVREFLERDGWTVEELPGVFVRLQCRGHSGEMTREAALLVALRRLVAPGEWRRRALRTRAEHEAPPVAIPVSTAPGPAPVLEGALPQPSESLPAAARLSAPARTDAAACRAG